MRPEEVHEQARAEGLELRVALNNTTGYFGVSHVANGSKSKRYQARVSPGGKQRQHLGYFATAEEAALSIARWQAAAPEAERAVATVPLTSEEARQQAQAEGLTLRVADSKKSKTGYYGVYPSTDCKLKPYKTAVRRNGKLKDLGYFATAEEAALCIARSPEGQAAAKKAAAAPPLTSEEADVVEVEVEVEVVAAEEAEDEQWAVVEAVEMVEVLEPEVVVDAGGRSRGRPKRRRNA